MSKTPLNPDALSSASDTISDRYDGNGYEGTANEIAEDAILAYLAVAQPVVNSFDPRELNRHGWTCGCEPGNYDTCDECWVTCTELADFLNRLETSK